ncbi:MAG: NADPH-dependent 2,4-dienoyl-CoA reductase/sulfur reductase-like enzyme [Roseivirga sp.]|jgi:NADPH-dependent 2,4-dienoyl-CoA reductase/sulfur reductase-like enzyme
MKYENIKPYEDSFWKKNRIELKRAFVEKIDKDNKTIQLSEGEVMAYDKLVIATGSKPNKFGWPGQDLGGVQGLYSFQDLETMEANTKNIARAVIVGGGLIGIEMAEMLRSRNIPVTFLVREKSFWDNVLPKGESEMINRHILEHHVDLRLSHELKEIVSDDNGRVKSIITGNGEEIQCQFVGLTAGVSPNIDFLKESGIDIKRGILVDAHLKTSVDDIYALGDCAEFLTPNGERKSIEQVWYTGRMMGEALARTLTGQPTQYKPGHWFNSAKFFDIEYQTYGWIFPEPREGEAHFHWQHKEGGKCITINYHEGSRKFLGINNFGIRMRQETFDKWLTEERSIDYVIDHLKQANFDPEFYKRHEKEILKSFKETLQQPQL